jgi:transcriptional regulator with XRE-family HTH domain
MDVKMLFGTKLRQYRKQAGFSQEQLAILVDVSPKHISVIERGLTFVSSDLLDQLAASLKVPVAAFFCAGTEKVIKVIDDRFFDHITEILEKSVRGAVDMIKNDLLQDTAQQSPDAPL